MSIACLPFDTDRCSLRGAGASPVPFEENHGRGARATVSLRRIEANRRNALKSTGPRTTAGKKRASRNALKHGLCASTVCLNSEDKPTFNLFLAELEEELQPRTAMQRIVFDQLVNAIWRLRRLPQAQADIFDEELKHAGDEGETLAPSQLLARRFSDDPRNGFLLMGRYETALRNGMLRLMRQYESLKKNRPTTPYRNEHEARVPREPAAPSAEQMRAQRQTFERRKEELEHHMPPRNEYEASTDQCLWAMAEQKRSHSKPAQNPAGDAETRIPVGLDARGLRNEANSERKPSEASKP